LQLAIVEAKLVVSQQYNQIMTTMTLDSEAAWRNRVAKRCGGKSFDAPGTGYSFSATIAEEDQLAKENVPGSPGTALLRLSVADPFWKLNQEAMDAGMHYYTHNPFATRYTDNTGVRANPALGLADDTHGLLALYLNSRFHGPGVEFTKNHVQYSPGSIKRLLANYVPGVLFDTDTTLVFPKPSYGVIASDINRQGAKLVTVDLTFNDGVWKIPYESVSFQSASGNRVMYVNMPHNPTGQGYTFDDWKKLIAWAKDNDVLLVVDEAYIDLVYRPGVVSVLTVPGWEDCCVVLQSVSKGWNATGLRFGWVVGHPTIIAAFRKVMDVQDSGLFGPSIVAGLHCLKQVEVVAGTRERYRELHRLLNDGLRSAGFVTLMPDAGLCQFMPAPKSADNVHFKDSYECASWLRRNLRVSVMPNVVNSMPWLRFAVTLTPVPECGLPTEASVIEEAVRRLKSVKLGF
jgi:aspartate/methionine/tyrosine aminotransferase